MEQLIQNLIHAPHKEVLFLVVVVCIFFYWTINKPFERLLEFIGEFKLRDIDSGQMKLFLEKGNFNDGLSDSLVSYFEASAFYKAYGIRADKEMRTALLEFYSLHEKEISWRDLRGAYKNIYLNESLSINIKPSIIATFYQLILNVAVFIASLLALISAVNYFLFDNSQQSALSFGFSVLYVWVLGFFHTIEWRSRSVSKVEARIDDVQHTQSEITEVIE